MISEDKRPGRLNVANLRPEIILAEERGFCFGVRRALEIIEAAGRRYGRVQSLGGIVHNLQVVKRLEEVGVTVVKSLDEVTTPVVAITAHGVGPGIPAEARARGYEVIDTTCPLVTKVHQAVKRLADDGFFIVIFGEPNHPEVRGALGWAGNARTLVTLNWEDIKKIKPLPHKIGIVSQTTQPVSLFSNFVKAIMDWAFPRPVEIRVINTICDPTIKRQQDAVELARQVDVMIVIGGRHSANTRHLAEMCAAEGVETHHIEVPEEVDPAWLRGRSRVGVTAGASTPDWIIEAVVRRLEEVADQVAAEAGVLTGD
jgi:4-hydroxy-3-methylbut-2-enyl diphosphate reductase